MSTDNARILNEMKANSRILVDCFMKRIHVDKRINR